MIFRLGLMMSLFAGVSVASAGVEDACGETAVRAMQALAGCGGKLAAELKKSPGLGVKSYRPLGSGGTEKVLKDKKGRKIGQSYTQEETWEFGLGNLTVPSEIKKVLRVVRKETETGLNAGAGGREHAAFECAITAPAESQNNPNPAVYDGQNAKPEDMNGHYEGSMPKQGVTPGYDRKAGDLTGN